MTTWITSLQVLYSTAWNQSVTPSPSPSMPSTATNLFDSSGAKFVALLAGLVAILAFLYAVAFGGRSIGQVRSERKEKSEAAIRTRLQAEPFTTSPVAHDNLPSQPLLIGRGADVTAAVLRLNSGDAQTLHVKGPAGIGKSAFALSVAAEYMSMDTELHAFLISAKTKEITVDSLADSIGRFFGVPAIESAPDVEAKAVILHRILGDNALLLILDNVESVAMEVLQFAIALPENVITIRTSRTSPPEHDGSVVFELRPLSERAQRELMASELFRLGLGALQDYPQDQVSQILELAGGNPLAIKWATGRLSLGISIHSVVKRLRRGDADLFENLFADNWTELTTESRGALMCTAMQGFTVGEDVLFPQIGLSPESSEAAVAQLVKLGLLEYTADPLVPGKWRYGLHPLARLFAQRKLQEDTARRAELYLAVLASLTSFFESRSLKQLGDTEYERLETELDSVDTTLRWLMNREIEDDPAHGISKAALKLINACSVILWSRGYWERRVTQAAFAVEIAEEGGYEFQATRSAATAGIVRYWQGRTEEAEQWADVAMGHVDRLGSSIEQGLPRRLRALLLHRKGFTGPAMAEMLTVLDSVREINVESVQSRETARLYADWVCTGEHGYRAGEVALTQEIGIMYIDRDEVDEAVYWLEKSRGIAESIGDDEGAAIARSHKGRALLSSDPVGSIAEFEAGLALARSVGRLSTEGRCLLGLATIGPQDGRASHLGQARSIFARLGMSAEIRLCDEVEETWRESARDPRRRRRRLSLFREDS